jgi:hypothetical protein
VSRLHTISKFYKKVLEVIVEVNDIVDLKVEIKYDATRVCVYIIDL